jgi:hypothetical protein
MTLLGLIAVAALVLPDARSGRDERLAAEVAKRRTDRAERLRRSPARAGRSGAEAPGRAAHRRAGAAGAAIARRRARGSHLADRPGARRARRAARHLPLGELLRVPRRLGRPAPAEDLASRIARLECVAVSSRVPTSERTTGSLIASLPGPVDFDRGRFTWCKFVQRPGELSIERDPAPAIPRACGG